MRRSVAPGAVTPPRLLRLAVLLSAALSAVWALAAPLGSVPDEPTHLVYAAAVVRGEAPDTTTEVVHVPSAIAGASVTLCPEYRRAVTADCIPSLDSSVGVTATTTTAGGYPRLYYALVGWPTLIAFGEVTWYLMRLLSVGLGAALLWVAALAWKQAPPAVAVATVVAVSPTTAFMLGAVNPQGLEIVGGVALVLASTGALRQWHQGALPRSALLAVGTTVSFMLVARPSSYVFAVALLGVLAVAGLPEVLGLVRRRPGWCLTGAAAFAAALLWAVLTRTANPTLHHGTEALSPREALVLVLEDLIFVLLEIGGGFNYNDFTAPLLLSAVPIALILGFAAAGWATARHFNQRLAVLLLLVGGTVIGPLFAVLTVFVSGSGYSARYAMPLVQALPVLGAAVWLPSQRVRSRERVRVLAAWLPLVVVVVHLLMVGGAWLRYGIGLPLPVGSQMLEAVEWVPPLWPLVLVGAGVAVLLANRLRDALTKNMPLHDTVARSSRGLGAGVS